MGIRIDEQLKWKDHINEVALKLKRANAVLCRVKEFVSTDTLRSIYYAIFDSHLNYGNLVWGQNTNASNYSSKKGIKINEFQT